MKLPLRIAFLFVPFLCTILLVHFMIYHPFIDSEAYISKRDSFIASLQKIAKSGPKSYLRETQLEIMLEKQGLSMNNDVEMDDIVFIVMGSSINKQKTRNVRDTWLKLATRWYVFSDEKDDELGTITLPELEGKPTKNDAQHRQLKGMQYLSRNESISAKWFMFVDDDSWVNIPALKRFLRIYNYELPVSFGKTRSVHL